MRYGSVCSGVEAATLAWEPLGWDCGWVSEIEPFPNAVLNHHWPDTPNLGDMTSDDFLERAAASGPIQCLVAGTPCQSFSVAGLRGGLGDDRGNLALRFCQTALHLQPSWLVWENVPGVLSSNGGRDFGAILGALVECGYGFAYRVLDAQHFGVPQRRRRVILVGYLGDWRPPAAVLFERESLQRDITPRRETREEVAPAVTGGPPYSRTGNERVEAEAIVPVMAAQLGSHQSGSGQRYDLDHETYVPEIAMVVNAREDPITASGKDVPLGAKDTGHAIAFQQNTRDEVRPMGGHGQIAGALSAEPGMKQQNYIAWSEELTASENVAGTIQYGGQGGRHDGVCLPNMQVRRLTPVECERLQGMPDHHTRIPWRNKPAEDCPDGPRYKAIGNSMAVPVMRWIGERIAMVADCIGYLDDGGP